MKYFKSATCLTLLLFSLSSFAQTTPGIDENWQRISNQRQTSIEDSKTLISEELRRLESAMVLANQDLGRADNPDCVEINCEQLEALYYQISKAEVEAATSLQIAKMATRNWESYYRNQRGGISSIESGVDDLETILFMQNVALTVAESAALIATGGSGVALSSFTGSATELTRRIATEQMNKYISSVANYSANRAFNYATDLQSSAGEALADGFSIGERNETALQSLGSQLSRVALVRTNGQGGFEWTVNPIAAKMSEKTRVTEVGVQVLIDYITSGTINETERQVREARETLNTALRQQSDVIRTIGYTRVAAVEAQRNRLEILELKNRIERLRAECNRQAAAHSCGIQNERSLREAAEAYETVLTAANAENEAASTRLETLRQQRDNAFVRAQNAHNELRGSRDQLSETTQTTTNRALIEELARSATDPAVRERYQQQLNALDNSSGQTAQSQDVERLEQEREAAWQEVQRLSSEITQASQSALATYSENDAVTSDAQIIYIQTLSTIEQNQLDCLEVLRPADLPPIERDRSTIERGGEYGPDEIFLPLSQTLAQIGTRIEQTNIRAILREDGECAIRYELSSCFQSDSPFDVMDLQLETAGINARATLMPSNDPFLGQSFPEGLPVPSVYTGTFTGNQLNLVHRYTETDRDQFRQLISMNDDDAVIDVLLRQGATASLRGTLSENVTVSELPGLPFGSLGPEGSPLNVMNLSLRALDFDFQTALDIPDSESCGGGTLLVDGGRVCAQRTDVDRNPMYFDFAVITLEDDTRWIEIEDVAQFVENPLIYTQSTFLEDQLVQSYLELGDSVWLEARANTFSCDFQQESVTVRIEPELNPDSGFTVELEETSPSSGIFRSNADGIELDFSSRDVIENGIGGGYVRFVIEGRDSSSNLTYSSALIYQP